MRGATGIGLLTLALVGVLACDKPPGETTGQTTTTSGETEEQRAAREQQNLPGAVPVTPPQDQPATKPDESAAEKAVEDTKDKVEGTKVESDQKKAAAEKKVRPMVKKTVITKKIIRPKVREEEPTSTTTITEVEIETVPPRQAPMQPLEPGAQGTPPGGMPLPTQVAGAPYVNQSTTLGNGNSGMYTGGQGTYGGRATWGTCCGVPAYPPVPQPLPPK